MQSSDMGEPEENRPKAGRKAMPVEVWYRSTGKSRFFRAWGQWSRWGRYRSKAVAEKVVADQERKSDIWEFYIGPRPA